MSERRSKQARRRRATLIREAFHLTPEEFKEQERSDETVARLLAMNEKQFGVFCFEMAKTVAQSPMRKMKKEVH